MIQNEYLNKIVRKNSKRIIMKKIIYFFFLTIILSGCSKDFLEIYPDTVLSEGSYYKTESDFVELANGMYLPMRSYTNNDAWVISELISDNGAKQFNSATGESTKGVVDQFLTSSDNTHYSNFWNLAYNGINRCNKLLEEIDNHGIEWSSNSIRERSIGEAYFLRGLYYFDLTRQFGAVPLVLNTISGDKAVDIKRTEEGEIYSSIINDLKQSIDHFSSTEDVTEKGRASLYAANAILGKVYLTDHKYDEAKPFLEAVINSGNYSLLPNYADLFDPTNKDYKETIFAIQFSESLPELSNQFIFRFAPWNSGGDITNQPAYNLVNTGGYNIPTDDLLEVFEPGDLRKDASINYWTGTDWDGEVRPIPYCAKFKPPVSAVDNSAGDSFPIIRYSDVLLMYAEILNETGNTSAAIPYVEQVRNRAGLNTPLTDYNNVSLDSLIAKERQKEFCFENQRWYDLKRTGKAIQVMMAHGIRMKAKYPFLPDNSYQINKNRLLAPIPTNQIVLNKLEQNPGY
jgi:tetratricopeptide (TPR) repeat protein